MADKLGAGGPATKKPAAGKAADSDALPCCEPDRIPTFNATTIQALEDAGAGIGVTEYADEVELFEKMGIQVGKAKAKARTGSPSPASTAPGPPDSEPIRAGREAAGEAGQ